MSGDDAFEIRTRRPSTPITQALQSGESRAEALAELLVQELDGGEGWTIQTPGALWWFPARLAVRVSYSPPGAGAQIDARIHVVRGATLTADLNHWLNDLNAQSLGWWWWFDEATGDVYCSLRCAAEPVAWWWAFILSRVLPHAATVAESMAGLLASVGQGDVAAVAHPELGPRPRRDGWIAGVELGPRDMSASLDPWLAESELARLHSALTSITGIDSHDVSDPLHVVIKDVEGEPIIMLRKHWHASWGWGWQFTTLTGLQAPGRRFDLEAGGLAVILNREQAMSSEPADRFGGWVYDPDLGMTHVTFVPAVLVDMLTSMAGPTIGDVAALMVDVGQRHEDMNRIGRAFESFSLVPELLPQDTPSLLQSISFRLGPIGWSYEIGDTPVPSSSVMDTSPDTWSADVPDPAWNVPKHMPICVFGIFNPMGPTVNSLEMALHDGPTGLQFALFHVMRHPHSPAVTLLGTVDDPDDLDALILESLADRSPESVLGGGPEWVEIWAHEAAILSGMRSYAEADDLGVDFRATADRLVEFALTPWARMSDDQPVDSTPWSSDADPIDCWIEAITDPVVVIGQRLFMRSAWEGALNYRKSDWDPAAAQRAADFSRDAAQERLQADVSSRQ